MFINKEVRNKSPTSIMICYKRQNTTSTLALKCYVGE
jgi:hypothetical protein